MDTSLQTWKLHCDSKQIIPICIICAVQYVLAMLAVWLVVLVISSYSWSTTLFQKELLTTMGWTGMAITDPKG